MQETLQELTEKLYREGVDRANEEANRLLEEARRKAAELVATARREADEARAAAEREIAGQRRNAEAELRLAARQALGDLKEKVAGLVTAKALGAPLREVLSDADFLRQLVLEIVRHAGTSLDGLRLEVPAALEGPARTWLEGKALAGLSAGLDLVADAGLAGGFRLGPASGGFVVSFTDEGFVEFFGEYLRPRARTFLFGDEG